MYFEKFLAKFVDPLLDKWKTLAVTHSLTVVYFGRTIFAQETMSNVPLQGRLSNDSIDITLCIEYTRLMSVPSLKQLSEGIFYQDYYKVVIDNGAEMDKKQFLRTLKAEFWKFPTIVNWKYGTSHSTSVLEGSNHDNATFSSEARMSDIFKYAVSSSISDGNVLEGINTTLNILDKHYMDRDLARTGNSMVMISAGCAYYKVIEYISMIYVKFYRWMKH